MNTEKLIEAVENNYLLGSEAKTALLEMLRGKKEEHLNDEDFAMQKYLKFYKLSPELAEHIHDGIKIGCAHVRSQQSTKDKEKDELIDFGKWIIANCLIPITLPSNEVYYVTPGHHTRMHISEAVKIYRELNKQ